METNSEGTRLLQQVTEGMKVYDSGGEEVGSVNFVQFADPEAVTTESDRGAGEGGVDPDVDLLDVFEGNEDSGATERMRQTGYIRIDSKGWFSGDKYVGAEHVGSVTGDEVRLTVSRDSL